MVDLAGWVDHETLIRLAEEVGLDRTSVVEALWGDAYISDVRQDETDAVRIGVSSVPTFLFAGAYLRSGAPSRKELYEALEHAWSAANATDRAE